MLTPLRTGVHLCLNVLVKNYLQSTFFVLLVFRPISVELFWFFQLYLQFLTPGQYSPVSGTKGSKRA